MQNKRELTQAVFFQGLGDPEVYPRPKGEVYVTGFPGERPRVKVVCVCVWVRVVCVCVCVCLKFVLVRYAGAGGGGARGRGGASRAGRPAGSRHESGVARSGRGNHDQDAGVPSANQR
jgi:hypothetical protein